MGRERQQMKNAETRKAILDAAIKIGLEEGFDALSIRKITDELGYSAGIVYHYFKDKQEILDTIRNEASLEMYENISSHIRPDRSFAQNAKVVFRIISEITVYEPDKFKLILLDKYSQNNEAVDVWIKMVSESIEFGKKSGELRDVDTGITAQIFLNTFLVLQIIMHDRNITDEKMIEQIYDTELDILLNGIIKKSDAGDA